MSQTDLTWNTALLYPAPDSPELEADLASFSGLAAAFRERYFEKIAGLDSGAVLACGRACRPNTSDTISTASRTKPIQSARRLCAL